MSGRVAVELDVAGLCGVDGVVATHATVVAREPVCAALAEDDVAGDHILFWCVLVVRFLNVVVSKSLSSFRMVSLSYLLSSLLPVVCLLRLLRRWLHLVLYATHVVLV